MTKFIPLFLAFIFSSIAAAESIDSDPVSGPWTKVVYCGDDLVIDVNAFNFYQIVLKGPLADQFSLVRDRNPDNQNEIVLGKVVYYGPAGCSVPEMLRQSFVQWNNEGNASLEFTGTQSVQVTIARGQQKITKVVTGCVIPEEMQK